jgi:hypothetical protein
MKGYTMGMPSICIERPNFARVDVGPVAMWFSYRTMIAFHVDGHSRVVRENDWGPTTGKHLKSIDGGDKKSRVSGEEFERLWKEQCDPLMPK